jgi:hypothetical protein
VTSARPDTRYLATTSGSTIDVDLGQRLTNLTASAPGGYEANSARTALTGEARGRSIEIKANIKSDSAGYIVDHSAGAGTVAYRIEVTMGGNVVFSDSSGVLMTIVAPGVTSVAKSYVVAWSTEPNPLTTGAPNALRSEFLVYAVVATTLSWDTAEHAVSTAPGTNTFTVGGRFAGGVMTNAYSPTIAAVRISCRFHTRVETREHFVAATSPPANVGIAACQVAVPPAAMLAAGQIVGPGYQLAAASAQTGRDRHRTLSAVWQWMNPDPPTLTDDMRTGMGTKHVIDIEDDISGPGWQTPLGWLARVQVPRHVEWLYVRIQWATWETVPGATDLVELQFHASNGPPRPVKDGNNFIPAFTITSYQTVSRQVDDGVGGLGDLEVFDFVHVERDADGFTWVWLAGRTDSGSGSGNASYAVRSCVAQPIVLGDGYGGQVPNGWGP